MKKIEKWIEKNIMALVFSFLLILISILTLFGLNSGNMEAKDWITASLAVVAIGISLVTICFTRIQTRIANVAKNAALRSAKTAEKAVGEGFRPYVIVKLYCLDLILHFEIVNLGNRTASDIFISIDRSFDDFLELKSLNKAVIGIKKLCKQKFLSPGHSIVTLIAKNDEYLAHFKENDSDIRKFTIQYNSIEYKQTTEKEFEFTESYEIDIKSFLINEKVASKSDIRQFSKISNQLEKMNNTLNSINWSLKKEDAEETEDGESLK